MEPAGMCSGEQRGQASLGITQHLGLDQGLICGWQGALLGAPLQPSCLGCQSPSLMSGVSAAFSQGAGVVARRRAFPCSQPRLRHLEAVRT